MRSCLPVRQRARDRHPPPVERRIEPTCAWQRHSADESRIGEYVGELGARCITTQRPESSRSIEHDVVEMPIGFPAMRFMNRGRCGNQLAVGPPLSNNRIDLDRGQVSRRQVAPPAGPGFPISGIRLEPTSAIGARAAATAGGICWYPCRTSLSATEPPIAESP